MACGKIAENFTRLVIGVSYAALALLLLQKKKIVSEFEYCFGEEFYVLMKTRTRRQATQNRVHSVVNY